MKASQNVKITEPNTKNVSFTTLQKKINDLHEIVKRTFIAVQKYKVMDVFGANELNICIQSLENLYEQTKTIQLSAVRC